jgi:hypothetical protein
MSMSGLLCPVAADGHAAPPARTTARAVNEDQRAGRTFTRFHVCEILLAHESRQGFPDRQEQ